MAAVVAIWRHAGTEDQLAARSLFVFVSGGAGPAVVPTRRRLAVAGVRLLVGAGLVALSTSTLLERKHLDGADITAALAAVGTLAGFSLILSPWWLRLGRELAGERRQRARAEERAEVAAHLHDSVLQTLALIQRAAGEPIEVKRLARAQERQLRSWLFDRTVPGPGPQPGTPSLSAALLGVQTDVETDHRLRTEVVTVGDAVLDERLNALVAATREAVVNAAKWSGADAVSIYAEVEPDAVSVFVRDRGKGFDPETVAPDRRGLSQSVHARMSRHGGRSVVRSAPGEGTEVALIMPRRPPA
jgi:signal transduction histidine kinase